MTLFYFWNPIFTLFFHFINQKEKETHEKHTPSSLTQVSLILAGILGFCHVRPILISLVTSAQKGHHGSVNYGRESVLMWIFPVTGLYDKLSELPFWLKTSLWLALNWKWGKLGSFCRIMIQNNGPNPHSTVPVIQISFFAISVRIHISCNYFPANWDRYIIPQKLTGLILTG